MANVTRNENDRMGFFWSEQGAGLFTATANETETHQSDNMCMQIQ